MSGVYFPKSLGFTLFAFVVASCTQPNATVVPEVSRAAVLGALSECDPTISLGKNIGNVGQFSLWRSAAGSEQFFRYVVTAGDAGCILAYEGKSQTPNNDRFNGPIQLFQIRDVIAPYQSVEGKGMRFQRFAISSILARQVIEQRAGFCVTETGARLARSQCQANIAAWLDENTAIFGFRAVEGNVDLDLINNKVYWNGEWLGPS